MNQYKKAMPEKLTKMAEWIKKRYSYKLLEFKNLKRALVRGKELFDLLDERYEELYGTVP